MKINPKQCLMCKTVFTPTGRCQKFCATCSEINRLARMKERHKRTYVRKGYNQKGANNNAWSGGIGIYRDLKKCTKCERCASTQLLLIHHKDENRHNNDLSNLECLCKRCHQIEHNCAGVLPKGKKLSELKKEQAAIAKRDDEGKFSK